MTTRKLPRDHTLNLPCCGTIPDQVPTHVLDDDFTVVVLVATGVLVGPLQRENGALVVVETSHVVSSSVVVLRVIEPGR